MKVIAMAGLALAGLAACSGVPVRLYSMPSGSMSPTIPVGATMLVNKEAYGISAPRRDDIVLLTVPVPSLDPFVKRIVAIPGDTFRMQHGIVYVNGQAVKEPFISEPASYDMAVRNYGIYVGEPGGKYAALPRDMANIPARNEWSAPDRLPPHCYIALGDNRNDSDDSHIWGCAQDKGNFASGVSAGKPAAFIGEVIKIYR